MPQDDQQVSSGRLKYLFQRVFGSRPVWMNALMLFCAYMAFVYMPWDFFAKPVADDQEVWFGIMLTGWAAKATEPLHWIIYAAGTWGFWKMRSWMWPWAALYIVQIAIGMFVWQLVDSRGQGLMAGALTALPFILLSLAMWRARWRFDSRTDQSPRDA